MSKPLHVWVHEKHWSVYRAENRHYYRYDGSGWVSEKKKGLQKLTELLMMPVYIVRFFTIALVRGEHEAYLAMMEFFCKRIPLSDLPD